ncbi:MAG: aldehyde dehydrogenase [Planctomycetota bacterium]|nr:MAG: aldehyde dehydrogenase [Planctomycetota bacterium]
MGTLTLQAPAAGTATAASPGRLRSIDPMTLQVLGEVEIRDRDWVARAAERARAAQPGWQALGVRGRNRVLERARQILLDEMEAFADRVARETGRTFNGALFADVIATLDLIAWHLRCAERYLRPERLPLRHYRLLGRRSWLISEPLGLVGVISPWNFPFYIAMQCVVPALVAGNAVILKPSEITPLVGEMVAELFERAGLPADVLQVASGDGRTGAAVVEQVDKVFFVGSGPTAKKILAAAATRLTPCVMELGGNAPALVLEDADLEHAARGLVWGAFFHAGQICASVQRIYAAEPIFERFRDLLVAETRKLRLSEDRRQADVGALTCDMQLRHVEQMVEQARREGARVLVGGRRPPGLKGLFYEPTILTDVQPSHRFCCEEVFGPVVMVMPFASEEQAVELANATPYGLHASVWSRDHRRAARLAERIRAGDVSINDHVTMAGLPDGPWGGVKQSGFGKLGSRYGLYEFVERRHLHLNRFAGIAMPWWFPETAEQLQGLKAMARALNAGSLRERGRAALAAVRALWPRLR